MALVNIASSILDAENGVTNFGDAVNSRLGNTVNRPSTPSSTTGSLFPAVSPTNSVGMRTEVPFSEVPICGDHDKMTFTEQLKVLLDDDNFEHLTWMPEGNAFTIINPKLFMKNHMPKYFNIRNMSSFVRKLSRCGFTRVHEKATMNSDIFRHPDFQRGTLHQSCHSPQLSVKGAMDGSLNPKVNNSKQAFRPVPAVSTPLLLPPSNSYTTTTLPDLAAQPPITKVALSLPPMLPTQTLALHRYYLEQQKFISWLRANAIREAPSGFAMHPGPVGPTSSCNHLQQRN